MSTLLQALVDPVEPPRVDTLAAWWESTSARRAHFDTTVDRAIIGGVCADRLGFAFASGYAEALRALVPGMTDIASLCATEDGGAHPRAICTTLTNGELVGKKTWATGANAAATLLVVASIGHDDQGKNRLRLVRVAADAPGVRLTVTSAPFVPEIAHAKVELDHVRVHDEAVLPGDGYDDYLKPFRTIEDAHVHAALAGYLVGVARRHGWREVVESWLAIALAARNVALSDPKAPSTHLALAGVLALAKQHVAELAARWAGSGDDEWQRWQRDRPLLDVASGARTARREAAWQRV
jgi:hypothetical protein